MFKNSVKIENIENIRYFRTKISNIFEQKYRMYIQYIEPTLTASECDWTMVVY